MKLLRRAGIPVALVTLLAVSAALYAPALGFEFLSYDDPDYVTKNPFVTAGLTAAGVRWAFFDAHAGNWHPLTWLSHMLDVEWFGLEPAGHHAVNVALHALNGAVLFLVLSALTGRRGRSFAVALVFALHPIQLESVAWVTERKNLLSTLFGLLAIGAYAGYARRGGRLRYAGVAGWMAASLMAKAMFVTLPFVLLLLDVWPLERSRAVKLRRLVCEKLPLLALAAGVGAVVFVTQAQAGAMDPSASVPLLERLAYTPIAYLGYLVHLLWPTGLAVLYPHPLIAEGAKLDLTQATLALLVLAAVSAIALRTSRRGRPAALIGWLWFLGTLVPVIGIVQVGWQGLADRYAYVPLIGLALAIVWSVADGLARWLAEPVRMTAGAILLAGACTLLAIGSRAQLGYWQRSRTIFERAIAVTGPNPVMHNELGVLAAVEGEYVLALNQFQKAATLAPNMSAAQQNLGAALAKQGRLKEALPHLEKSVRLAPDHVPARVQLAQVLVSLRRYDEAREHLEAALEVEPAHPKALALLAQLRLGHPDPAERDPAAAVALAQRAVQAAPAPDASLFAVLASSYAAAGRLDDAIAAQRQALVAAGDGPLAASVSRRLKQLENLRAARTTR